MELHVSKIRIFLKNGRPTPFYWRKEDGTDRTRQTVYKRTTTGSVRMKGVHFNVQKNEFEKE